MHRGAQPRRRGRRARRRGRRTAQRGQERAWPGHTKTSAMSERPIRVSRKGEVTVVTLDRPPANALDPSLLRAGAEIVDELLADPPGAVVLTGSGAFFSGGADLRVVPDLTPAD